MGKERRKAGAEEHSLGHLGVSADTGLPGREPGMGGPGELQCSALRVLQREENQEKTGLGKRWCTGERSSSQGSEF